MSLSPALNQTILDTVLDRLGLLFLIAAGNLEKARQAAIQALTGYHVRTEEELRLAAEVISFGFHALQTLAQADDAELPLNRILRLRGSAVSLSRQAHQSQRKLDQLQRARRLEAPEQASPEQPAEPPAQPMPPENMAHENMAHENMARAFQQAERVVKQIVAKDGGRRWSQAYKKRQMAERMAERAKQVKASHAAQLSPAASPAQAAPQAG